ncbi:glycosyl hydrolase family 95 catalytic domain-containing protein [Cohnella hashimotonis]|uniref:Glycoside hydrolase N-terminal domain-containing protein n=1 Tax=Cohnella hashimotonis TaxID=2826895 RepID=A0ABT6TIQ3_9BACL|nr:glycoside hydrolase N-terminal domain-containing protein [Cohnella hashimotonis]MDI4646441.1 glycoside hydrolase N-terminal domain-containing protein [Cohnella hashimotonis]
MERAAAHGIRYDRPAATFFEGALLGNGKLGAVVTTRPDAIVIHFGHNNVWDIRIAENNKEKIGTFESLFARLKEIPSHYSSLSEDPWYREYVEMASANYARPYPRPMPCGSLLLGFDRRRVEVLGHTLRIHDGMCEIDLLADGRQVQLLTFVEQDKDALRLALRTDGGPEDVPIVFNRVKLIADPETPQELPAPSPFMDAPRGLMAFRQRLPAAVGGEPKDGGQANDRAFRLTATFEPAAGLHAGASSWEGLLNPVRAEGRFEVRVALDEGLDADVPEPEAAQQDGDADFASAFAQATDSWSRFWSRSGVALGDAFLERIWYRNLYFFNCAVSPDAICPGLFANWSYGKIGSEWHGDYHMNYNTQQPFWLAFSSNHVDKHLAYVDMVERIGPVSRKWAREYYGLRGAYYPHSAYPVEMTMMPYPVPHWGWEICETPWTVQSLWWHYLYTMDLDFLAGRAFGPIRDAALFMVDYMKRPDARGETWGDDRYHVYPTVAPELYELTPGFRLNRDCIVDLTLTKFLFHAFRQACAALGRTEAEAELLAEVEEVLAHFPDYPTARSARGTVYVSVPGEDPEVVYNVPNGVATVFPGEDHGLHSPPDDYAIAANSYLNHRNEGGNDLVFYAMAGARLGMLDLERFKRQIDYCMLPNGTCTDKLLEAGGRYSDTTPFDYMGQMGIWFENFALPAVINECLLQSYNGVLRLFPNWPKHLPASFATLRAVGGFLVSASFEKGCVQWVEIVSEAGAPLRMHNPWTGDVAVKRNGTEETASGALLEWHATAGTLFRLTPA